MSKKGNSPPPVQNGNGGFYPGGFGQPGVRETKVVGETSEIRIPRKQFFETWIFSFLLMILGYACLKILITDRGDWSLLIGIFTIPALIASYLFFERKIAYKYFPNVWADFMAFIWRCCQTDDIGRFMAFVLPVACIILISAGFYIYTIVPQLTLIFDQQAQFVFVFGAFLSLFFAFIPYYQFNKRQLTDSLRDSDSHYATRALELEYEKQQRKEEAMQALLDAPVAQPESEFVQAVPLIKASTRPNAPMIQAQIRFKMAVLDFLDGIDEGKWDTTERSWRNDPITGKKILPKSKHDLYGPIGNMIRDELIRGEWARWKSPNEPQRGWELLYSTDEIRRGAFADGNTVGSAGRNGNTGNSSGASSDIIDNG